MTMISLVLLGSLTVTSYQPIAGQTDSSPTWTSVGDRTTKYGVAVSQDMLADGRAHYGDVLYVPGFGYRVVNDCMGLTHKVDVRVIQGGTRRVRMAQRNAIDLLVFTRKEEHRVGVRHINIYRMEKPQ